MAKFGSDVLGAWVLKCNPQMWDIVAFMADGNRVIDGWSVQDNVRAKNMVSGEPVVLWVSGSSSTIEAGAWGVGQVAGPAAPVLPTSIGWPSPAVCTCLLTFELIGVSSREMRRSRVLFSQDQS